MTILKVLLVVATLAVLPTPAEAHGREHSWGRREQVERVSVAPRFERGHGRAWVPGSWGWRDPRRIWITGRWAVPPQPDWVWVPARWVWNGYGWVWQEGNWSPAPY